MKAEIPDIISSEDFAEIVGLTPRHVRNLVSDGVCASAGRGKIALKASIQGLLDHARRSADRDAEAASRAALNEIRRRREAVRLAITEGSYIPVEEAEAIIDEIFGAVRLSLDSLPDRIAGNDWQLRRKIETARDAALQAASDKLAELADRSGK